MKTASLPIARRRKLSPRATEILKAARDARKTAVKFAKMHKVPMIYMRDGKLIRERV